MQSDLINMTKSDLSLLKNVPYPKEQVLVRSQLIQADGKAVNFDYVMRQGASHHWKIINILADGVSDLALKRAEYSAIIQRDGFSALLSLLEQKIIQAEQHH